MTRTQGQSHETAGQQPAGEGRPKSGGFKGPHQSQGESVTGKPEGCASCGGPLEQPETGRPRVYCSVPCRRLAERKLKVAEQLLARARRQEQTARERAATWDSADSRKKVKFWAGEVERCEAELAALLAGAGDDDDPLA